MIRRIRRRLTLGYVGIFALILTLLGVAVTTTFFLQTSKQQDELLDQRADATTDYVRSALLRPDHRERGPGEHGPEEHGPEERGHADEPGGDGPPLGPIRSATDTDIGLVAVRISDGAGGEGEVLQSSSSSSALGLPYGYPANQAATGEKTIRGTLEGPGGKWMRVVSVPVTEPGEEEVVVQAAQPRRVVWGRVGGLVALLVPVGLGGLLLAGVGGMFMSRRAMHPVEDSFRRQRAFIADASHEVKTPLALVKIGAEVMRRDPTGPDNGEVVEDQLSEINRMDALLSDLLTLARLDAGRLEVEDKPFDLAAVAGEAAGRFLTRAAEEGVRLEVELPESIPARGDPGRTAQILAALLDNAVRHTPKGGTVTVSGRALDDRAEANVRDTGAGVPPEHLPRIFDRFYRAEEARTRAGGGTGLGLAIARDLARAQKGDLSAENVPEGGAIFSLDLPVR